MFQQLLLALDYCHRLGVANRDIKLDNVLLTSSKKPAGIKLTDFGFCKGDKDSIAKSLVGTAFYMGAMSMSPEAPHAPCGNCVAQHNNSGMILPILSVAPAALL